MTDDIFGTELVLDLAGCDPDVIGSAQRLAELATQLCKLIGMQPYGDPIIEHFGHAEAKTAGYTLVQLIETSSIVAHFSEAWQTGYINVFSCQPFDADLATGFVQGYLDADRVHHTVLIRR